MYNDFSGAQQPNAGMAYQHQQYPGAPGIGVGVGAASMGMPYQQQQQQPQHAAPSAYTYGSGQTYDPREPWSGTGGGGW